jgi:hypothetical protein
MLLTVAIVSGIAIPIAKVVETMTFDCDDRTVAKFRACSQQLNRTPRRKRAPFPPFEGGSVPKSPALLDCRIEVPAIGQLDHSNQRERKHGDNECQEDFAEIRHAGDSRLKAKIGYQYIK